MNSDTPVDRRARIVFPSDSPTAYADLANEVDRLNAKNTALVAELLAMRDHLAKVTRDIHCPGTDGDCPRACTTNLCEIMVEQEKVRHGCG